MRKKNVRSHPWFLLKCLALSILLLFLLVLLTIWIFFRVQRQRWTDTQALAKIVPIETSRTINARRLYAETRRALESSQASQLSFDNAELQALMREAPELQHAEAQMHFELDGELLKSRMSLPLGNVPGMQGRYLNGDFVFSLRIDEGKPELKLLSGTVKGRPLPEKYLRRINQFGQARLMQALGGSAEIKRIESLRIEESRLNMKIKRK
ncbi:MAG: hypothetical protein PHG44_10610 [Lentisphaeria bacterium]|nr:hypothetical protein [Lentisphaeria bacterium]